jgi:anti-sigma factor (TIGR02949 family)
MQIIWRENNMDSHATCHQLLDSLSDYVDGSLKDELCQEIQHHLEECENCRVVVDTLRKTIYLVQSNAAKPGEIPTDVRERLFRRLDLEDFIEKK